MADVIRDAQIRLSLKQEQAQIKAPDLRPVNQEIEKAKAKATELSKAHEEVSRKVSEESRKQAESIQTANRKITESTSQTAESQRQSFEVIRNETNRTAESLSQLAESAGLFGIAMDNSLPPSVRLFSSLRGGVALMRGMTAGFSQLGGVLAGPVGLGIAAVTTAITLGVTAWKAYSDSAKEATEASEEAARANLAALGAARKANREFLLEAREAIVGGPSQEALANRSLKDRNVARLLENRLDSAGGNSGSAAGQSIAIVGLLDRANAAEQQRLATAKEQLQVAKEIGETRERAIRAGQNELDIARSLVEAEQKRRDSLQAGVGSLNSGEQRRLRQLTDFSKQRDLTREELLQLQQLGGGLTSDFVEKEFAKRGQGLAGEVGQAFGVDLNADLERAQQQAAERLRKLEEITGGISAEAAIEEIEGRRQVAVAQAEEAIASVEAILADIAASVVRIGEKVKASEEAAGAN